MMRLPRFEYHAPPTVGEAVQILFEEGPEASVLAGGTDLLPNMKRRQQTPRVLVSLREIDVLRNVQNTRGMTLGACVTLTDLVQETKIRRLYPGLWQAAAQIATPPHHA